MVANHRLVVTYGDVDEETLGFLWMHNSNVLDLHSHRQRNKSATEITEIKLKIQKEVQCHKILDQGRKKREWGRVGNKGGDRAYL